MRPLTCDGVGQRERTAVFLSIMPKKSYNHMATNQSLSLFDSDCIKQAKEMYELVQVVDGQVVTTSLRVAEYFKKQHKDVLRAIKSLDCSDEFNGRNFALVAYQDAKGEQRPMYYLTRDGFTLLAMGFTGKVAARFKEAYIEAFNLMEESLRKGGIMKFANSMLKFEVNRLNQKLKKTIAQGQLKYGMAYGPAGELMSGLPFFEDADFERNLRNVFAHINNAFADSYFFVSELKKKDDLINQMKEALEAIRLESAKILGY